MDERNEMKKETEAGERTRNETWKRNRNETRQPEHHWCCGSAAGLLRAPSRWDGPRLHSKIHRNTVESFTARLRRHSDDRSSTGIRERDSPRAVAMMLHLGLREDVERATE